MHYLHHNTALLALFDPMDLCVRYHLLCQSCEHRSKGLRHLGITCLCRLCRLSRSSGPSFSFMGFGSRWPSRRSSRDKNVFIVAVFVVVITIITCTVTTLIFSVALMA